MSKSDKRNKAKNNQSTKNHDAEKQTNHGHQSPKSIHETSGYFFSSQKRDSISQMLAEDESEAFDFIEVFYRYGQFQQANQFKLNDSQLNIENE